jgi:hypothetical protein
VSRYSSGCAWRGESSGDGERENGKNGRGIRKWSVTVMEKEQSPCLLNVLIHCRRILLIRTSFMTHLIDVIPRIKPRNALEEKEEGSRRRFESLALVDGYIERECVRV